MTMFRRGSRWPFFSSKPRRRRARRALGVESLSGAAGWRAPRYEAFEPRLLLTNTAPLLNAGDSATFNAIAENIPADANRGETVSAMLATGGAVVNGSPPPSYFIDYDTTNYGIAVTRVIGAADGVWEYSTTGNYDWSLFPTNLSTSKALLLSCGSTQGDWVRFLPNANFTGSVGLEFVAWDQSDGRQAGTIVDLSAAGATGGGTPYSTTSSTGMLQVTSGVAPSFNLPATADTVLENYTDANNPGGGNAGVTQQFNVATGIVPGNGGGNTVTFHVTETDSGGYLINPAIDASGTLTFQLSQNKYGTATLSVTASNGALTSAAKTTRVAIEQTTPPSFTATSEAALDLK